MELKEKITAFLIDDEEKSISNLKNLIAKYCQNIEVIGSNQSALEAISEIKKKAPKVLFLDIQMPNINGLDFLKLIDNLNLIVVLVSAYDKYAMQAIKLNVFDYLLKPISIRELIEVEKKITALLNTNELTKSSTTETPEIHNFNKEQGEQKIVFSSQEGSLVEEISNILYFKSESNYTMVYRTNGKNILLSKTLKHFENNLKNNHFARVHNSYLINLHQVKQVYKKQGNYLVMKNGEEIVVSRRKLADFEKKFNLIFKKL